MARPCENGHTPLAPARFIRLDRDTDELITRICREQEKSLGLFIRGVIRDGLEARGYLRTPKVRRAG